MVTERFGNLGSEKVHYRAIEAKEHRVSSQRSQRPFKINKHLTFTRHGTSPSKQKRARPPRKPEFRPGHEYRRKKVNNNHRRLSMSTKSHLQTQHREPYTHSGINPTASTRGHEYRYTDRGTGALEPGHRNPEGGATREHRTSSKIQWNKVEYGCSNQARRVSN
jgi:hypothetical protein